MIYRSAGFKSRPTQVGRGLKSQASAKAYTLAESPHACGAWIEVFSISAVLLFVHSRPTHVGRGLKYLEGRPCQAKWSSPHACGAWIEVSEFTILGPGGGVAPRMWGVD